MLFNEYISELKAVEEEKQRESKAKKEEQVRLSEIPNSLLQEPAFIIVKLYVSLYGLVIWERGKVR